MKKSIFASILSISVLSLSLLSVSAQVLTDTLDAPNVDSCVQLTKGMTTGSRDSTTEGQVSDLQFFLSDKGYLRTDPTGYFGLATLAAVKAFQGDNGITQNGLVGPITRAKIASLTCSGDEPVSGNEPVSTTPSSSIGNLSVNLTYRGGDTLVPGGSSAQNVNPLSPRTWSWTTTGAASVSARYSIYGPNCVLSAGTTMTEENWQPWLGINISGTRFSGSNTRTLGSEYYGCTIEATYRARNTQNQTVASTVKVTFAPSATAVGVPNCPVFVPPPNVPAGCKYTQTGTTPMQCPIYELKCAVTDSVCPIPMLPNPPLGCTYVQKASSTNNNCPVYELKCGVTNLKCNVGGCSNQICSDKPVSELITTCEYKQEYSCYQTAKCERQENGECGWTQTTTLLQCIADTRQTSTPTCPTGTTWSGTSCSASSSCPAGTVSKMINYAAHCAPVSSTTCPTGTILAYVSGTAVCNVTSTGGTGSTPAGPSATGLSCYQKDLYENGKLKQVCPKAPNGGIACEVSLGGCAGEGYVWINGQKVKWAGNISGSCFADSACEMNYVCNKSISPNKCEPKAEWSGDSSVTGMVGAQAKRIWAGSTWGPWTMLSCLSGYEVNPNDTGKCILKTGPVIDSFTITPTEIYSGDAVTVNWQTTGAVTCTLRGSSVAVDGQKSYNPTSATDYLLECKSANGMTITKTAQVTLKDNPTTPKVILSASAGTVDPGQSVTVSWSALDYVNDGTLTSNGDGCHFTEPASLTDWTSGVGFTSKRPTSGSVSYTINADTTFKMWCRGSVRTHQAYSNELVVKVTPPPVISFSATEGTMSISGIWSGKSITSNLSVAGKGLVSCRITNDDLSFYNQVYPSGHSVPSGYASVGSSIRNIDNYLVNYPANLTLPVGYQRLSLSDYNLGKGTTYRATCTGIGGTTTKTDSF